MSKVALVTGGTRGIGAPIALALKEKGYTVIVTYHSNAVAAKKFQKENQIPVYQWDISNFEACQKGISEVIKNHGPIDVLVNNGGITRDGVLHRQSTDHWNHVIGTNLTSCFNMTRGVVESMRERGFGRIINISSVNALRGQIGQANYCASKAGIIGFTKALALENAKKGITVNAIAPGYIDTDMVRAVSEPILGKIIDTIPLGRLGQAKEIARAVVFLADDDAGYITGETLNINGGLLCT
ncbi:MAG: acetoacetyl-CoA reductase [Alphaproteobacteria bacterium]|jgi:acetoacetyl-CoA reductase|nr:acetoacetyl-CoA reductase [Alphaproteobacteria bacterium]